MLPELIMRVAKTRDENAFALLFSYFAPKVRAYGLRHLRIDGQAMELVQETMMLVWRKAHLYDDSRGTATTWVYAIMRNVSFDMLRKLKTNREDCFNRDYWSLLEKSTDEFEQEEIAIQDQVSTELEDCINRLPKRQQQVVNRIYLEQLTHHEVAEQLDIPLGTVKSRLRLGLEKLRSTFDGKNHL